MSDENKMKFKNGIFIKITITVMIICVVVGIWAIKNNKKGTGWGSNDNSDFGLLVTKKLDLENLKSYGLPIVIDFGSDTCI